MELSRTPSLLCDLSLTCQMKRVMLLLRYFLTKMKINLISSWRKASAMVGASPLPKVDEMKMLMSLDLMFS